MSFQFFRRFPIVTVFHNPTVDASYQALIRLRSAQLYDKAKNPLPVSFELDIIAPPLGMTLLQKDLVVGALQRQKVEQYYVEQRKLGKKEDEIPAPPAPQIALEPPLVASWGTNQAASGSFEDLQKIIDTLRDEQWKGYDRQQEPGKLRDSWWRFKNWWNAYE